MRSSAPMFFFEVGPLSKPKPNSSPLSAPTRVSLLRGRAYTRGSPRRSGTFSFCSPALSELYIPMGGPWEHRGKSPSCGSQRCSRGRRPSCCTSHVWCTIFVWQFCSSTTPTVQTTINWRYIFARWQTWAFRHLCLFTVTIMAPQSEQRRPFATMTLFCQRSQVCCLAMLS